MCQRRRPHLFSVRPRERRPDEGSGAARSTLRAAGHRRSGAFAGGLIGGSSSTSLHGCLLPPHVRRENARAAPSARNFVDMSSSDFRRPYTGRSNSAAPSQGSMRATPGSFGMGATGNLGSSLGRGPTMGVVVPSNTGRPRNFVSPADEVRAIARAAARAAESATNSRAAASVASEGEIARSTMPLPPGAALPQTMFGGFDATARAAARGASGFPAGVGPRRVSPPPRIFRVPAAATTAMRSALRCAERHRRQR